MSNGPGERCLKICHFVPFFCIYHSWFTSNTPIFFLCFPLKGLATLRPTGCPSGLISLTYRDHKVSTFSDQEINTLNHLSYLARYESFSRRLEILNKNKCLSSFIPFLMVCPIYWKSFSLTKNWYHWKFKWVCKNLISSSYLLKCMVT